MRLRKLLGDDPVLVIKRLRDTNGVQGVDFMILKASEPKGRRCRESGFLPLTQAIKRFEDVKAKYES